MSFGDHRRSPSAFSFAADPEVTQTVSITPNRRSIDDRFPVLGFTVRTGGLPFFEVLLATDRSLFAPANAGRRSAANFYASRQDSGLIRASSPEAVYLVPPAILRAFAQAVPRPSAIYYTLIAYHSAQGDGPVFAQAPESLPDDAPSVALTADFAGQTLSTVLGIPVERLKPVYAPAPASEYSVAYNESALSGDYRDDAGADRAEGEDGYDARQSARQQSWPENEYALRPYQDEQSDLFAAQDISAESYAADSLSHEESKVADYADNTSGDEGELGYQDGYEDRDGPVQHAIAAAQESVFPAGAMEPAPLSDEEPPYGEDLADDESPYGEDLSSVALDAGECDRAYGDSSTVAGGEEAESHDEPEYDAAAMHAEPSYAEDYDEGLAYEEYDPEEGGHEGGEAAHKNGHYGDETGTAFQALDSPPAATTGPPLTIDIKKRIIECIAQFESGRERYRAINPDGGYEGRFGTNHPAYQRFHIGLSYGLIQFTQDSGLLGRLLVMMRQRDAQAFSQMFGSNPNTLQQLIDVTTAPGPPSSRSPNGRSARVQPVGGADLWREPWLSRFRQAGQHVPFQAAQNQLAAEAFLDPMLRFASWLELNTERALAMVVDRAIQMERGGASHWIISVVGPVQTDALRGQALAALGHGDLRQFQRATPGLRDDGEFRPVTHAAMVAALRALGARSPVPIPTREQMMDAMVRGAVGRPWASRVRELRQAGDLGDTPLQF